MNGKIGNGNRNGKIGFKRVDLFYSRICNLESS